MEASLQMALSPEKMIRPRRRITGMSAILLPFLDDGSVDWDGFRAHVRRTADAGLTPAVNMDTGYVNLLMPKPAARCWSRRAMFWKVAPSWRARL